MSVNLINEFGDMPELEGRMGVREVARLRCLNSKFATFMAHVRLDAVCVSWCLFLVVVCVRNQCVL